MANHDTVRVELEPLDLGWNGSIVGFRTTEPTRKRVLQEIQHCDSMSLSEKARWTIEMSYRWPALLLAVRRQEFVMHLGQMELQKRGTKRHRSVVAMPALANPGLMPIEDMRT